jgi:hypothetical protein
MADNTRNKKKNETKNARRSFFWFLVFFWTFTEKNKRMASLPFTERGTLRVGPLRVDIDVTMLAHEDNRETPGDVRVDAVALQMFVDDCCEISADLNLTCSFDDFDAAFKLYCEHKQLRSASGFDAFHAAHTLYCEQRSQRTERVPYADVFGRVLFMGAGVDAHCLVNVRVCAQWRASIAPALWAAVEFTHDGVTDHYLLPVSGLPRMLADFEGWFGGTRCLVDKRDTAQLCAWFEASRTCKFAHRPQGHLAAHHLRVSG